MIKTQEQFLQEALELKKQNPEMDIHFFVDSEQVLESGFTAHKIEKVEISPWFEDGDQIILDEDQIKEHLECFLYDEYENDVELAKAVDRKYDAEVKKAICIYTYAG